MSEIDRLETRIDLPGLKEAEFSLMRADIVIEGTASAKEPELFLRGNIHHDYRNGILKVTEKGTGVLAEAMGVTLALAQHGPTEESTPRPPVVGGGLSLSFTFARLWLPYPTGTDLLREIKRINIFSQLGGITLKAAVLENVELNAYSTPGPVIIADTSLRKASITTHGNSVSIQNSVAADGWEIQVPKGRSPYTENIIGILTVTHPK